MKIECTKEFTITMTEKELSAIKDFVGHTSHNQRVDLGVSNEQAHLLYDMFKDIMDYKKGRI